MFLFLYKVCLVPKQNNYALANKMSFLTIFLWKEKGGVFKRVCLLLLGVMTIAVPSSGLEKDEFAVQALLNVLP